MILNFIAILLIIAFDQTVKLWAYTSLRATGTIPLIDGIIHFTYAENRGAAFSIMSGKVPILLVITSAAIIIALIALVRYYRTSALLRWAIVFIIGGAVGNFIDRVRLGFVVDMFDFRIINFAIFNVADSFITIGALMAAIYVVRGLLIDHRSAKNEQA